VSRFAFVAAERANHAVVTLCRIIGASVSGFYAWLRAIPAGQDRAEAEAELRGHIGRVFAARRRAYGAPRVHAELRREGRRHSRRRVARLMRAMGLAARRGRRRTPRTTDSRHDLPVAPNLLDRNFAAGRPDTVWLADLSYLPTDEGFLYLAAVEDMATREIVGWSMADHLRAGLCVDALVMALQRCRPPEGLIHHSDRGVQYVSIRYTERLAEAGIEPSVGSVGDSYDNALAETIIGLYKTELIRQQGPWRTLEAVELATLAWVNWFNHRRLFEPLGNVPPAEKEFEYYRSIESAVAA
jgi:transposase InsO family protein